MERDPNAIKSRLLALDRLMHDMPDSQGKAVGMFIWDVENGVQEAVENIDKMLWAIRSMEYWLSVIATTDQFVRALQLEQPNEMPCDRWCHEEFDGDASGWGPRNQRRIDIFYLLKQGREYSVLWPKPNKELHGQERTFEKDFYYLA